MDGLDGIFGKAVAIAFAAGQHTLDVGSHSLEVLVEQGGGGHAVHIVVTKDNNGLFPVDGIEDAAQALSMSVRSMGSVSSSSPDSRVRASAGS